jgi:hypothetical protein
MHGETNTHIFVGIAFLAIGNLIRSIILTLGLVYSSCRS